METKFCPFCGNNHGVQFAMSQGYKWGAVECPDCGARGPEVRTYYDKSGDATWREEAVREWNRRAGEATWATQ
jgi:Lar family restriction alleviation protein